MIHNVLASIQCIAACVKFHGHYTELNVRVLPSTPDVARELGIWRAIHIHLVLSQPSLLDNQENGPQN